jgi:ribosomal protein S26
MNVLIHCSDWRGLGVYGTYCVYCVPCGNENPNQKSLDVGNLESYVTGQRVQTVIHFEASILECYIESYR